MPLSTRWHDRNYVIRQGTAAITLLSLLGMAASMQYVVGDSFGWTLPDMTNGLSYPSWAASIQNFYVGDTLVFNYNTNSHTVAQVNALDYEKCSTKRPMGKVYTEGLTILMLQGVGFYYFISTGLEDCDNGMKFAVYANPSPMKSETWFLQGSWALCAVTLMLGSCWPLFL